MIAQNEVVTNLFLEELKKNNPSVEVTEETEHYNIKNLWTDDTFMLRYPKDTDLSALIDVQMPSELAAIFHKKDQTLEFIYQPLLSSEKFLNRKTKIYYNGVEFVTEFKEPSPALKLIAQGFKESNSPGESNYRNLNRFRDFYREDQQTSQMKTYFQNRQPYCFFVTGNFKALKNEFIGLCKHYNIYSRFYDRESPMINIINIEPRNEKYTVPCKTNEGEYPEVVSFNSIDQVALDLLHTANETGSYRLKYLFYYQVLEYFAYYYLDEEIKKKLSNILKNPDIISNRNTYSKVIFDELKDYSNSNHDKQKLRRVVSDYISVGDISNEIKSNLKYFSSNLEFDGGFKLHALLSDGNEFKDNFADKEDIKDKKKEKGNNNISINSIVDKIENIRNVLVHIRENRENKVIYPTRSNNRKLLPYLYLIRRIAEIVAMKCSI